MKIHTLPKDPGRQQKAKRVGRGEGSGHGKTSGYGHKGSQARSGRGKGYGSAFEGGQMPLTRRLPKRGFHNPFRVEYEVVNVSSLEKSFSAGETVTPAELRARRIVRTKLPVKLLGNGDLKKNLTVRVDAFSASALEKVTNAGGTCEAAKAEAK
jgi:large subunit ribosomal protein L15